MHRVELSNDGLFAIDQGILQSALATVRGVEFQIFHHIAQQHARLEHLNLVVDTRRIGHDTQIQHVRQHLVGITLLVLVLNQQSGRHLVSGFRITEIQQCPTNKDDE